MIESIRNLRKFPEMLKVGVRVGVGVGARVGVKGYKNRGFVKR
jgi:hypothetical protein